MNALLTNAPFAGLLSFFLTTALVYTLAETWTRRGRVFQKRLGQISGDLQTPLPLPDAGKMPPGPRPDTLPTVTRWLSGSGCEKRLRRAMIRADFRMRPAEWIILCAVSVASFSLLGLLLTRSVLSGLVFGLIGLAAPLIVQSRRQEARQQKFEAQTSDMLQLMTASLRAGHSFAQAMETVSAEMPPPMASEFAWAAGEAKLGVPLETALGRMLERVPSSDLDLIVTAILIQLPLGGNLAEILAAIADTIRERVRVQGEVRTLTAEGRLSALVLIVLVPVLAFFLHLRNPDYFQPLLETTLGRSLIGEAIVGQIIGALLIKKMVDLDT
jgi:tight adherence protein B